MCTSVEPRGPEQPRRLVKGSCRCVLIPEEAARGRRLQVCLLTKIRFGLSGNRCCRWESQHLKHLVLTSEAEDLCCRDEGHKFPPFLRRRASALADEESLTSSGLRKSRSLRFNGQFVPGGSTLFCPGTKRLLARNATLSSGFLPLESFDALNRRHSGCRVLANLPTWSPASQRGLHLPAGAASINKNVGARKS